jgi:drug/metabolite transporter (DMT)-like permease
MHRAISGFKMKRGYRDGEAIMGRSVAERTALQWVLICVFLNAAGQILFKAARTAQPTASGLSVLSQVETWAAFVIYGVSTACWLWVLSRARLSVAYPLLSLAFPIVVGFSALFFSESISAIRWVGVGIIVTGVSLLPRR